MSKLVELLASLKTQESVTFTTQADKMTAKVIRRDSMGQRIEATHYFSLRELHHATYADYIVMTGVESALRKTREHRYGNTDVRPAADGVGNDG